MLPSQASFSPTSTAAIQAPQRPQSPHTHHAPASAGADDRVLSGSSPAQSSTSGQPATPQHADVLKPPLWSPERSGPSVVSSPPGLPVGRLADTLSSWHMHAAEGRSGGPSARVSAVYPARGPNPLSPSEHAAIIEAFQSEVPGIFGDHLDYGFICGSVARGHAIRGDDHTPGDDIDTFLSLHVVDAAQVAAYTDWITALHRRFGMKVDEDYPHEIVSRGDLDDRVFPHLATVALSLHFNSSRTFDTVTWSEMISSDKVAQVGSATRLLADQHYVAGHVRRLADDLLQALDVGGHRADMARAYWHSQQAGGDEAKDFAGGLGSWRQLEKFSLPRLMRRLVPLPEAPPPEGTSELAEALMALPVLRGEHVLLRPIAPGDAAALFDMCARPEVARFCTWYPQSSIEESSAFITAQIARRQKGAASPWAITLLGEDGEPGPLIGTCGLVEVDEENRHGELGIALHPDHQGKQLGSEALALAVGFLKELPGLHKIFADCVTQNTRSKILMLRLGLRQEGHSRQHVFKDDRPFDLERYAWVRGDAPL